MKTQRNALISVSNKNGIEGFAQRLIKLKFKIFSTGNTAKALKKAGIKVTDVAKITGMPAILDHRVVTLHPAIHSGLLAKDTPEHLKELKKYGFPWFHLACVDLYDLESAVDDPSATREGVIEKTDIGGVTMISSSAKGRRITICDPADRNAVLDWLEQGEPNRDAFISELCAKADFVVSRYRALSAGFHSNGKYRGEFYTRTQELAYGENRWQTPALLYKAWGADEDPLALWKYKLLSGKPLSYNNMCDFDRLMQTVSHIVSGFSRNFATAPVSIVLGVKHGNCCGASIGNTNEDAISKAIGGNILSIYGGSLMCTFPVDEALAAHILSVHMKSGKKRMLDMIIAPKFSQGAIAVLGKRAKCRVVALPELSYLHSMGKKRLDVRMRGRDIRGGKMLQPNYTFVYDLNAPSVEKHGASSLTQKTDMVLAWAIGSTSNSNTITLVRNGMLLGNGVGQQDRVEAADLAIRRARSGLRLRNQNTSLEGSVAYSDSFFPFPDGPRKLLKAGIKAFITTNGSQNDAKVLKVLKAKKDVVLYWQPDSEARGFFGH